AIYTLSLHDALPIYPLSVRADDADAPHASAGQDLGRVAVGDSLGEDHHERHAVVDGFERRVPGRSTRDEEHGNVDLVMPHRGAHGVVDGEPVHVDAALARRHAGHDPRAVLHHVLQVGPGLLTCDPLDQHAAPFVEKDAHRTRRETALLSGKSTLCTATPILWFRSPPAPRSSTTRLCPSTLPSSRMHPQKGGLKSGERTG